MTDSTPPDTRDAALATGSGAPAPAAVTAEPDRPTGPLTHRQIVTILIGLMIGHVPRRARPDDRRDGDPHHRRRPPGPRRTRPGRRPPT